MDWLTSRYGIKAPKKANDPLSLGTKKHRKVIVGVLMLGAASLALVQQHIQIAPGQQSIRSFIEVRVKGHHGYLAKEVIPLAIVVFLTTGTSYSRPSDWNNANNKIEAIGGGGSSAVGFSGCCLLFGGGGAGGAAYARADNVTLAASTPYAIGAGPTAPVTNGGDTTFNTTTVLAKGGGATSPTVTGGTGGQASACRGGVGGGILNPGAPYARNGGNGGSAPSTSGVQSSGAGGGGAGGLNGNGNPGASLTTGGTGDAGFGGAANGGAGAEWTATAGGTAGSGGGGNGSSGIGGTGGLYGGGGGGSGAGQSVVGAGRQGIIVITYTPGGKGFPNIAMLGF
jgi:hypothetical protein